MSSEQTVDDVEAQPTEVFFLKRPSQLSVIETSASAIVAPITQVMAAETPAVDPTTQGPEVSMQQLSLGTPAISTESALQDPNFSSQPPAPAIDPTTKACGKMAEEVPPPKLSSSTIDPTTRHPDNTAADLALEKHFCQTPAAAIHPTTQASGKMAEEVPPENFPSPAIDSTTRHPDNAAANLALHEHSYQIPAASIDPTTQASGNMAAEVSPQTAVVPSDPTTPSSDNMAAEVTFAGLSTQYQLSFHSYANTFGLIQNVMGIGYLYGRISLRKKLWYYFLSCPVWKLGQEPTA